MTDKKMVIVPKEASDEMHDAFDGVCLPQFYGESFLDGWEQIIQSSPNGGKVSPEMVEAVAKIVASVGCKNCREKWQMYRDDAIEIVQALGLEVGNE